MIQTPAQTKWHTENIVFVSIFVAVFLYMIFFGLGVVREAFGFDSKMVIKKDTLYHAQAAVQIEHSANEELSQELTRLNKVADQQIVKIVEFQEAKEKIAEQVQEIKQAKVLKVQAVKPTPLVPTPPTRLKPTLKPIKAQSLNSQPVHSEPVIASPSRESPSTEANLESIQQAYQQFFGKN